MGARVLGLLGVVLVGCSGSTVGAGEAETPAASSASSRVATRKLPTEVLAESLPLVEGDEGVRIVWMDVLHTKLDWVLRLRERGGQVTARRASLSRVLPTTVEILIERELAEAARLREVEQCLMAAGFWELPSDDTGSRSCRDGSGAQIEVRRAGKSHLVQRAHLAHSGCRDPAAAELWRCIQALRPRR